MGIYHDLFLADTYIGLDSTLYRKIDSVSAYQGIIESHGYTVQQFNAAQDFYIAHPENFAKMMKKLQQQLISERNDLGKHAPDSLELDFDLEKPIRENIDL